MKKYLYTMILILSALQVHSKAATAEAALTRREVLEKVSPVATETLRRLEVRRGASYKDDKLNSLLQNSEFKREHGLVHREFCERKANAANLACTTRK